MLPALSIWLAMMMMSGSAGRTRKMFARADSTSSGMPPRKPALTPMSTASSVAPTPVTRPTIMTDRVPTSSCENTSRPRWSVPSQCEPDGGASRSRLTSLGLCGAIHGPMIASTTNTARITRPVIDLALRTKTNFFFLRCAGSVDGPSTALSTRLSVSTGTAAAGSMGRFDIVSPPDGCADRGTRRPRRRGCSPGARPP